MRTIQVVQDQLEYVGLFATPVFGLRSLREKVVSGLYNAFLGMHAGLSDFHVESDPALALPDTIAVNLTTRGTYRFHRERIEWTFPSAGGAEMDASVLERGDTWLRSALPALHFQTHYYTYLAHTWVLEGSAKEFLLSLDSPQLAGFGENLGTGLIFHAHFPDHAWSMQLTVDHSNVVSEGLFVQIVAAITADRVNHQETVRYIDKLFREGLERLGLRLDRFVG